MGLPEILISFKTKGTTAITRSARGIVAVILKDDMEQGKAQEVYTSLADVDFTAWSQRNYDYLKLIFEGSPSKVVVIRMAADAADLSPALKRLKNLKWNYLTVPGAAEKDLPVLTSWVKDARDNEKKTFKAVLANNTADHEGIINFTTDNISSTLSDTAFSTVEYCARIAGVLAGLSLARSSTYYVLTDITAADVPDDPGARIDKGELVLVFDSEKYKIGRGVNSLTTFTAEKGSDFAKIKIVEGMDLYQDDIRGTFEDGYIGKVTNSYDNKQAFVAAVCAYQRALAGDVLDESYDNTAGVDIAAQKLYLDGKGIDTTKMDDTAIAQANTGSKVFLQSQVKFIDAMEDLQLVCNM